MDLSFQFAAAECGVKDFTQTFYKHIALSLLSPDTNWRFHKFKKFFLGDYSRDCIALFLAAVHFVLVVTFIIPHFSASKVLAQ